MSNDQERVKRLEAALARNAMSRMDFLRRSGMFAGAVALGAGLAACGGGEGGGEAAPAGEGDTGAAGDEGGGGGGETLNFLSWPGHGDPHFVRPFEEEHNVTVRVKEYTGGEQMLALATSSPPGTFDVILADAEYVTQLKQADQIVPLDPADYAFEDFFEEFQQFEGHWLDGELYSVILRFGYLGMVYNTDQFSEDEVQSYEAMWSDKAKGRLGWFDWYLPSMGCLSLYNGNTPPFDIDDAAFAELRDTLFSLKDQTAGFYSMADVFSNFSNGQCWLMDGVGDWISQLLSAEGQPIASIVPQEGGLQWTESLSIAKGAQNPELAKEFIQYATSPEGQWRTATLPSYQASIPSRPGWEALAENEPEWADRLRLRLDEPNVLDEYKEGRIHIRKTPVQQSIEDWNEVWTEFKAL